MTRVRIVALSAALSLLTMGALAQTKNAALQSIDAYREMLADGNPADLFEETGAQLWKMSAGPKRVSLEQCDLGLGAGVVAGAYAQLPRFFADTGKVQDVESRLLSCMERLQGIDPQPYIDAKFGSQLKEHMVALATYISGQSKNMPIKVVPTHPQERKMAELGKRVFFFQAGPHDFACATCHGSEGLRIRMQELPYIPSREGAGVGWTSWPAYRVSVGQMWSMQWRINDCFRQQRFPEPVYASDMTIALSMYLASTASGEIMKTPGIKR